MENAFFDLHIHASFKHFLTLTRRGRRRSIWKQIPHWTNPAGSLLPWLKSQSSLGQLADASVNTAVVSLYALEYPLARAVHNFGLTYLFTPITRHFVRSIAEEKHSYFQLLEKELDFLLEECNKGAARVLRRSDLRKEQQLNLILSIEGGHSLFGEDEAATMANLLRIKQSDYRILYLTLNHLTRSPLSNHAFAMKKIMGRMLLGPEVLPGSVGISETGKTFIHTALDPAQGQQILIDIKHMSLQARLDFYRMRKEEGLEEVPIIASHCAATGFAYQDLGRQVDWNHSGLEGDHVKLAYVRGTKMGSRPFNPWSLNLYDEEIREIIDSNGLIGLTLDERVLGGTEDGPEYFFADEFAQLFPKIYSRLLKDEVTEEPAQAGFSLPRPQAQLFRSRNQLYMLAHNILHMVKVGGPRTWEHLCLGSDFDGMIKPINRCRSILSYKNLENGPPRDLVSAIQKMAGADPAFEQPIPDLKAKVRGILFDNADRFLKRYL